MLTTTVTNLVTTTLPRIETRDRGPQSPPAASISCFDARGGSFRPSPPSLASKRETELPSPHQQPPPCVSTRGGVLFDLPHPPSRRNTRRRSPIPTSSPPSRVSTQGGVVFNHPHPPSRRNARRRSPIPSTSPPSRVSTQGGPSLPSVASKRKTEVPNPHQQPSISRFDARGAVFNLLHLLRVETRGGGLPSSPPALLAQGGVFDPTLPLLPAPAPPTTVENERLCPFSSILMYCSIIVYNIINNIFTLINDRLQPVTNWL